MKSSNQTRIFIGAALLLVSWSAWSVRPPVGAGIYGTPHDFTGSGFETSFATVGLCTICHTPHSAFSTALLWNQRLTTATFTWGDVTQTTGGTTLPSSAHLGPSTKCLSCHDGTVAIGDTSVFSNAPGGRTADNPIFGTYVTKMGAGNVDSIGYRGDMKGNHPIAVPYPLNGVTSTYNGIATGSSVSLSDFVANPHAPTAKSIKLYTDDGSGKVNAGTVVAKTGIECTSCHDPHNKQVQDKLFLRGKIAGSTAASGYICLQCHIK